VGIAGLEAAVFEAIARVWTPELVGIVTVV
jgi:hypothetical protein